jgi:hypothetical protein
LPPLGVATAEIRKTEAATTTPEERARAPPLCTSFSTPKIMAL